MRYFFIFLILTASLTARAQGIDSAFYKKIPLTKHTYSIVPSVTLTQPTATQNLKLRPIVNAFDPNALPFFCKIEYNMGLQAKLPIKFRLGDPDKVDELENKARFTPKQ